MMRFGKLSVLAAALLLPALFLTACRSPDPEIDEGGIRPMPEPTENTAPAPSSSPTPAEKVLPVTMRRVAYGDSRLIPTVCALTDFGAVPDDDLFDDDALTEAIRYARKAGGGTVWVPAGRYRFQKSFALPNGVYLAGVWENPDTAPDAMQSGSIFEVLGGKRAPTEREQAAPGFTGIPPGDRPFITLGAGSGVIGLTVYYPEQDAAAPFAYPPTFAAGDTKRRSSGFSVVKYTTIVNPWVGIVMGPGWNELGMTDHVYMSPLKAGYFANMTTDIGKIMDLSVSAQYYAQFDPRVDREKLIETMKASTVGVEVQRSDWQYICRLRVCDVHTGYRLSRFRDAADVSDSTNSQIFDLFMRNVGVGIDAQYSKLIQQCTLLDIEADRQAILASGAFSGHLSVTASRLCSLADSAVRLEAGSPGSITLCDTRLRSGGGDAVRIEGGSLIAENCIFEEDGTLLLNGADTCAVNRCLVRIQNEKCGRLAEGKDPPALQELQEFADAYAVDSGHIPQPGGDLLRVFEADRSGKTDCTAALREGLDAVHAAGGGILYVPAGLYRIDGTLTVPSGVELRGCFESGHHSNAGGTVLVASRDKEQKDEVPLITLQENAGLCGVTIWYAEQDPKVPMRCPPAVFSDARGVWVVNTCIGNAWEGLVLQGDTGGHYISNLTGFSFCRSLHIDGSRSRGYVVNCHFNPHFYARTEADLLPGGNPTPGDAFMSLLSLCDRTVRGAVAFGKTTDEQVFQTFNYRGACGLELMQTDAGAFSGRMLGVGFDGSRRSVEIEAADGPVLFVNAGMDCVPGSSAYMKAGGGELLLVNPAASAFNFTPDDGLVVRNGRVQVRAGSFGAGAKNGTVRVCGGTADVTASVIRHVGPVSGKDFSEQKPSDCRDFVQEGGALTLGCNLARRFLNSTGADSPLTLATEN